jgi:hypothetical protein
LFIDRINWFEIFGVKEVIQNISEVWRQWWNTRGGLWKVTSGYFEDKDHTGKLETHGMY